MTRLKLSLTALALVAAGSLACISVAGAQTKLEVTPFAGYYIASDIYNSFATGSTPNGSGNVALENSFMYGGRLTFSSPRGGLEFAYTRTGSDVKLNSLLSGQQHAKVGRIDIDNWDINFLGYQPSGNPRVTPFGLIGFGWAVTHPTIDSDVLANPPVGVTPKTPPSNTLFNFNFGLGTKIEMSSKLALRIEGRWRVTDTAITTSSGIWCDGWGYCYSYASDWYNSGELIGGITYALR
jgi:opacity protein-like surface antigen